MKKYRKVTQVTMIGPLLIPFVSKAYPITANIRRWFEKIAKLLLQ